MPAIAHQNKILGDDIQSIHWSQAKTSVKKNLLPNRATSTTVNDIAVTVNGDKSITFNGTATGDVIVTLYEFFENELPQGRYTFTCDGLPRNNSFQAVVDTADAQGAYVSRLAWIASGINTTFDVDYSNYVNVYPFIYVANGTTIDNVTVYPMLRDASISDSTYVPYIKDNVELDADKAGKTQITNPNLLDNPWFTVNQRGASSYASGVYSVDRWKTAGASASFAVNNDELTIDATSATQFGIVYEELETDFCKKIYGKTITFSIMFSDGTIISKSETVPNSAPTSASLDLCNMSSYYDYGFATAVYFQTSGNFHIQIGVSAGHSITLKAVKLELGSISTLALDTPPNYATELLKCQRYYFKPALSNDGERSCLIGEAKSTRYITGVPFPTRMRTIPIFSSGRISSFMSSSIYVDTNIGFDSTADGITAVSNGNDSNVVGDSYYILFEASADL